MTRDRLDDAFLRLRAAAHADEYVPMEDVIEFVLAENERLRAAAEEVLSWNTGDTSTLLSNPPQNAGLFHAQRVLRAALEKKP